MANGQGQTFDPDSFHQQFTQAGGFDPDKFHEQYTSTRPPPPTGNAGTQERPLVTPLPGEDFAATMKRGAEMGKQVTPQQRESATAEGVKDIPLVLAAASTPSLVTSLAEGAIAGFPGLYKLGRGLIGAGVGSGLGQPAGAGIGGLFGETGRKVGGVIGAIGGGVLGGGLAAGLERQPATALQSLRGQPGSIRPLPFGIQRAIPDFLVPRPSTEALAAAQSRAEQEQFGAWMNRGYKPTLALNPSEGAVSSQVAADEPVLHVPEPREAMPGEKPGSMYSVPRAELDPAAQRGKAGALDVLRDLGKPMIVIPKGAGDYPGPRPPSSVGELPQGNATPFQGLPNLTEERSALVEPTQAANTSEMTPQRASRVVRDPRATSEELVAAWRVLRGKK